MYRESAIRDHSRTPEAKRQSIQRKAERNDKRARCEQTLEAIRDHKSERGWN